jgi:hypothetical protein
MESREPQEENSPTRLAHSISDFRDNAGKMIAHATKVVAEYGAVLEQRTARGLSLFSEEELAQPKNEIRKCIEFLMLGPLDQLQRGNLEVANMFLNDYISEAEYRGIESQQAALSKAVQLQAADGKDAMEIARLLLDSATPASQLLLRQIQDRVEQENKETLERHKLLRLASERLTSSADS